MGSIKRLFSDLTPNTPFPYTVKVRVFEKSRAQISASQNRYQNLILKDEQGHAMKAILYNQDIDTYKSTIEEGKEYNISNPKIKKIKEEYKDRYQNVDKEHELSFTKRTVVQQLANTDGNSFPIYLRISDLPRVAGSEERFDLLAVVIYVEDRRKILGFDGRYKDVREIVTLDDSSNQMITVSAWQDLAREESQSLQDLASLFPVIGFKRLKLSNYKGLSFTTTPSTYFDKQPKGERVEILKKWRDSNLITLIHRQQQVMIARKGPTETENISIEDIKQQQVIDTIQEEQHWLHIFILDFQRNQISMFLGCNHCNASTKYEGTIMNECPVCAEHNSMSIKRLLFSFKAVDQTGTLPLVAHGVVTEKILRHTATKIY